MILDLFAGPGGWSEGLRMLGLADVGIEWDVAACATRAAAGHLTIRADVASYPCAPFRGLVEGLIASPPCQDFSMAGKRAGRTGEKGQLIDDVPRWVDELRPRWIALEQVPPALPVWEEFAHLFRSWGYAAWCGLLNAADYGVPQTRVRAILIARRDGRPALPPPQTHDREARPGALFGDDLEPWVSMAEALGWGATERPYVTLAGGTGGGPCYDMTGGSGGREQMLRERAEGRWIVNTGRDWRPGDSPGDNVEEGFGPDAEPSQTVTGRSDRWVVRTGRNSMVTGRSGSRAGDGDVRPYERSVDQPAPTLDTGAVSGWKVLVNTGHDWKEGGSREDAQTFDASERPAPTLDGKGRWHAELVREATATTGARSRETVVPADDVAPTLAFGHNAAAWKWQERWSGGIPAGDPEWPLHRPATTLAGDPRVPQPGHKKDEGNPDSPERMAGAIRLGIEEASVLQSFPIDYPWQGTKTKQFEQVGNAVPPVLARAILATLVESP